MSFYTPDVYYQAEQFGLTQIGEIEWAEPDYSFDIGVVWRDAAGQLYYGRDSGCSCPSPFEDYTSLDQLEKFTFAELETKLKQSVEAEVTSTWRRGPSRDKLNAEVVDLLIKAREV